MAEQHRTFSVINRSLSLTYRRLWDYGNVNEIDQIQSFALNVLNLVCTAGIEINVLLPDSFPFNSLLLHNPNNHKPTVSVFHRQCSHHFALNIYIISTLKKKTIFSFFRNDRHFNERKSGLLKHTSFSSSSPLLHCFLLARHTVAPERMVPLLGSKVYRPMCVTHK